MKQYKRVIWFQLDVSVRLMHQAWLLKLILFLFSFDLIFSKNLREMEYSGTFKNSSLFPENQLQMQHSK